MKLIQETKQIIRRLILGHNISTYYFSQSGEDAIIQNIFSSKLSNKEPGFFIDIGAFHPQHHSNTNLLYINGWSGINIDPRPGSMRLFNKYRKRDINLEIGVSDKKEKLIYYFIDDNSPMNSFSRSNLEKLGMLKRVKQEILIDVYPLNEILNKYLPNNQQIDLINIDAEGYEFKILKSLDWNKYCPKVIIVEMEASSLLDVINNDVSKFFFALNYEIAAKTVLLKNLGSVIFVHNSFNY
ncbi:MAG: FkbM family methyltransferase [Salinivirgaceae bacterium]|jgi:FkbM family methyltransferase